MKRRSGPRYDRPPPVAVWLGILGLLLFLAPLVGLAVETPWADLASLLRRPFVLDAARLSRARPSAATPSGGAACSGSRCIG